MTDRSATLSLNPVVAISTATELTTSDAPHIHEGPKTPATLNADSTANRRRGRSMGTRDDVSSALRVDSNHQPIERPHLVNFGTSRNVDSSHQPKSRVHSHAEDGDLLNEFILGAENRLVAQGIGIERDIGCINASDEDATDSARRESERQPGSQSNRTESPNKHGEISELRFDAVPLTVYGKSGYGKSQFLRAIQATWIRQQGSDETILISAIDFSRRYANSQTLDDLPRFQQRYQRIPLLLIDDLEQLRRKSGAQELLAQVIDHRQRHHRPTVLASHVAPQFAKLGERLVSRMSSGLVAPLQLPSENTRAVILQRVCEQFGMQLTTGAQQLLNAQELTTVPEIIGVVSRLFATQAQAILAARIESNEPVIGWSQDSVSQTVISEAQMREVLESRPDTQPVDPKRIIREVANYFGLSTRQVTGKSRRKMEVQARSIAMYLIRQSSALSFQKIGESFGKRDHSTVMHACEKISDKLNSDAQLRTSVNELRRKLSA